MTDFEVFLKQKGRPKGFVDASESDIAEWSSELSRRGALNRDSLLGLLRYSRFCRNHEATAAVLVLLESDLLQTMASSFKERFGENVHREVLGGFKAPALGTAAKAIPSFTNQFMDRLESGMGQEATRRFLMDCCPHLSLPGHYSKERELFLASKNIDDYLDERRRLFVEELEGHIRDGTLFYNQKVDESVIEYVKENPEVGVGERRGGTIYHTKIPYMTIEYLHDDDPTLKRYHYCHCPLARESILSGETVHRDLCYCSGGYCKRPFEIAFDAPLEVKVLKSALWGDSVCQFAVKIPDDLLEKKGNKKSK